ncbi:MAG: hypothetical protein ACKO0M_02935 [Cyanobium sp.]
MVPVIVIATAIAFYSVLDALSGKAYYQTQNWPFAISLLVSAIICWFAGTALRKRTARIVIDKETGQEMVLQRGYHSFFFIPIHIWGPILVGLAIVLFFV